MKGRFRRRSWIAGAVLLSVLALLAAGLARFRKPAEPDSKVLINAGTALQQNRPSEALQLALGYMRQVPQSAAARYIAAQAAERMGSKKEALQLLEGMSQADGSDAAVEGAIMAGNLYVEQGRTKDAEARYRHALSHRPNDVAANRKLAFLLTVEGRRWESRPYLLELVSQQRHNVEELQILGMLWSDYEHSRELERVRQEQPDEPLPLLGLARLAANKQQIPKARGMLQEVIKAYPDLVEAHAWLGWTLVQDPEGAATLGSWEAALPANASDHPMVWLVRGLGAEHLGQREAAIRCFGEALRRDPNYEVAAYQLSRTLAAIGQVDAASAVGERAKLLYELVTILKDAHQQAKADTRTCQKLAESMKSLGRIREAWAWYLLIVAVDPKQTWASAEAESLQGRLKEGPYLSLAEALPELTLDLSQYPLPQWPAPQPRVAVRKQAGVSPVRFVDSAASAGIDFTYYSGYEPGKGNVLGINGGGVGVLDYDGDLWPDLYFTQGADWPVDPAASAHRDCLYRNLGNGMFEDVTQQACLGDNSYSHGVAAGDFDNDGHPDLYLANCGVNRLYRNNGDGTFSDISSRAGITSNDWTASCLVADLNGDSLPDLFDVNYLGGDALTRRCPSGPCGPHLFPGQQDRLLLNGGDGTFRDVTSIAGINAKNGKGLGVVTADFALAGRLSLFVANDVTPNFYYENVTPPGEPVPRFAENGVLAGLAYDGNGVAMAGMGAAADDATGDGSIDLFVTNFYSESNTFYLAEAAGKTYSDRTAEFGLREGSLQMLGFGTQFLDGELDGWPDLIITNGHVHDRVTEGIPLRMRPQYFQNLAGKAFAELPAESLGPFFAKQYLGRGLARLDWNRDGREDVAISHIGSPAALLTNQTTPSGHYLALQLRGTMGSRDAIGAVARLKVGERTLTRQLTAGDGYQASNQRQLVFGLGSADHIDHLEIRWLNGTRQTFADVSVDAEYIALEGRDSLVRLPSRLH